MAQIDSLPGDSSMNVRRSLVYALLAASIAAWVACPLRYLRLLRVIPSILIALEYVAIVFLAAFSAAISSSGPRLQLADLEVRRSSLRATAVAIWMAPLMLLVLERSAMGGMLAAGMVLAVYGLLGSATRASADSAAFFASTPVAVRPTFSLTQSRAFVKQLTLSILASALLQCAIIANSVYERELALLLFVVGAIFLATLVHSAQEQSIVQTARQSHTHIFASAIMATFAVVIGLLPLLSPAGRPTRPLDASIWKLLFRPPTVQAAHSPSIRIEETRIRPSDGYVGVILTPKRSKQEQATTLSQLSFRAQAHGFMRTLRIPFTGAYWFFQSPFVRPPLDSITAEGDPAGIGVRSSNYRPLLMEAVQSLYQPIETAKLGQIQIDVRDIDAFPGTVSVELVLVDTETWGHPRQSLGIQRLAAPTVIDNPSSSHQENMNFLVPPRAQCREFNEIRLIFSLDPSRSRQAAAIAVQSFMLVPRSM